MILACPNIWDTQFFPVPAENDDKRLDFGVAQFQTPVWSLGQMSYETVDI